MHNYNRKVFQPRNVAVQVMSTSETAFKSLNPRPGRGMRQVVHYVCAARGLTQLQRKPKPTEMGRDTDTRSDQALLRGGSGDSHASTACCWICLEDGTQEQPLRALCSCPGRPVHERCLARWCLQQAGRDEEKRCRFCKAALPDYRAMLLRTNSQKQPAPTPASLPNIRVHYGNVTIVMPLHPGEEGKQNFEASVKAVLGLPDSQALQINFQCKEPGTSGAETANRVQLSGIDTYDAAFWCASMTAAERQITGASSHSAQAQQLPPPQPQAQPPLHASQAQVLRHMHSAPAGMAMPLLHSAMMRQHSGAAQAQARPRAHKKPGFFAQLFGLHR